jgi:excisionase family DNA binding protein
MPPNKYLVSLAAAAEYADVNPRTVRRWIASRRITAYRVGPRLIKVDLNELETSFHPVWSPARSGGGGG